MIGFAELLIIPFAIILYMVPIVIFAFILYYVIKKAVKTAILEAQEEMNILKENGKNEENKVVKAVEENDN